MNAFGAAVKTLPARMAVQKTSLIDYPGKVSAVLFLPGCNFLCPYCHNPSLVRPPFPEDMLSLEEVLAFLDSRRRVLSGVVLSGGEPLLHESLPDLAAEVRERGFLVKLDTNGSFPERIAAAGADFIALDVKASPESYGRVAPEVPDAGERLLESLRIVRGLKVPYELRITCAPGVVDEKEIRGIAEILEPEDIVVLQGFRPRVVLDPRWRKEPPSPDSLLEEYARILKSRAALVRIRSSL